MVKESVDLPAINRMDSPKRRIEESEVRNENVMRVNELNEVASGVLQCSVPPKIPPHLPLPINCTILSCNTIEIQFIKCFLSEFQITGLKFIKGEGTHSNNQTDN